MRNEQRLGTSCLRRDLQGSAARCACWALLAWVAVGWQCIQLVTTATRLTLLPATSAPVSRASKSAACRSRSGAGAEDPPTERTLHGAVSTFQQATRDARDRSILSGTADPSLVADPLTPARTVASMGVPEGLGMQRSCAALGPVPKSTGTQTSA